DVRHVRRNGARNVRRRLLRSLTNDPAFHHQRDQEARGARARGAPAPALPAAAGAAAPARDRERRRARLRDQFRDRLLTPSQPCGETGRPPAWVTSQALASNVKLLARNNKSPY